MDTNVPAIQFLPTGLSVPTEAAVLAGVQQDINGAFGNNLNFALNTPQGQLSSAESAAVAAANAVFAAIVNGIDPDTAVGFMQDAIARINFINRNPGVATVVQCNCSGANVTIPVGAQAQDTSGNLYVCTAGGSIGGSDGSVSCTFANVEIGAIPCPASTLTIIYQGISGWESITNPAPGVVGAAIETPAALEFRRQNSVSKNGNGFLASVYGQVFSVANVIDVFCYENDTSGAVTYGATNFSLAASSIYVGVIGGASSAIAQAIYSFKSPGCNYNGNTTVSVTDTSGNYQNPPSYNIKFNNNSQNPANTYFSVVVPNVSTYPANIQSLIQAAIVNQFTAGATIVNQSTGQAVTLPRARIASTLTASDYTASVNQVAGSGTFISVTSIGIGTTFSGDATLESGSDVLTVTTATSGLLSFGTVVAGTDIPANTYIQQQLTGTAGGVGTYQMSANATGTVGSPEAITGTPGAAATYGIDQAPTISASNVTVTLA
jgi:hypothetical protein